MTPRVLASDKPTHASGQSSSLELQRDRIRSKEVAKCLVRHDLILLGISHALRRPGSVNARHTCSGESDKSFSTMIDSLRFVASCCSLIFHLPQDRPEARQTLLPEIAVFVDPAKQRPKSLRIGAIKDLAAFAAVQNQTAFSQNAKVFQSE
jgi:hypothetical protein